ncbi:MAG: nucleoside monophosphate kinase [Alphaproteobacteria bacterium]|nr:nucleoside monophosphate kinase [Alphaproteobacteria bacterium]
MKPKMILLMGGQGVGKGTHARALIARDGYGYIETGAILRSLSPESRIAQIMARGELVPDTDLFQLVSDAIGKTSGNIILDGFPRTLGQAQWIVQNYADKFDIRVIYLNVPENIMLARIQKRIREGGGRADDADNAIVRRRLDSFFKITMPAIEWFRTADGISFSDVDVTDEDFNVNFSRVSRAIA